MTVDGHALAGLPACAQRDLIVRKEITPAELLKVHLEVIRTHNETVNAIITIDEAGAFEAARQATAAVERGDRLGPLHGLPVGVKDITETAGMRTTYASPLFVENVPAEDAEVVRRLRRAGAIILGKTNTPEFAAGANTVNRVFGATRNPWNTALTPAGSSGGSAVAVATGMVSLAHGTDFGCSLRMPASFCGLIGLRTTPGLIPNSPMPMLWDPGQVHGPLARSAEDAALMLDAMTLQDLKWPNAVRASWDCAVSALKRGIDTNIKVAFVPDIAGMGADREISDVCRTSALSLADVGCTVEEIDFDVSEGIAAYGTLRAHWMVEQQYHRLDRLDELDANLASNVRQGLELTSRDIAAAAHVRDLVWRKFDRLFETYDFLLTPTAPVLPFPVEQNFPKKIGGRVQTNYVGWMAQCFLITMCSLVACSVPAGKSRSGLPIGMQVVSPRLQEPRVLALSSLIQERNGLPIETVTPRKRAA